MNRGGETAKIALGLFKLTVPKDTLFPAPTSSAIPDPHPQGYMYGSNVLTMGSPAAVPPDMQAAAKAGTLQPSDQTSLNPSWAWAAGAGISTVADLASWVEALADGKLLDPDMQARRIASLQSTNPAQPRCAAVRAGHREIRCAVWAYR